MTSVTPRTRFGCETGEYPPSAGDRVLARPEHTQLILATRGACCLISYGLEWDTSFVLESRLWRTSGRFSF
jgi:hypothetical protein